MGRKKTDDDLFRESTMTFGEHLEELRACLFKALLGLVIGFVIGLFLASDVIELIQTPLESTLKEYYKGAATERIEKQVEQLEKQGLPLPGRPEQLADLIATENVLPEQVFVQPSQILPQLRASYQRARDESGRAAERLRAAEELARRLALPPNDAKRDLTREECDRLAQAIESITPSEVGDGNPNDGPTRVDLDRVAGAIRDGKQADPAELARLTGVIASERQRLETDEARASQALDLFDRTRLPARRPFDTLSQDDLAPMFIWRSVEGDPRIQANALSPQEAFMIFVKGGLLVGVLLASPWIFYQIWSFVAAGLYHHERRFVHVFLPFSLVLFLAGVALAFFFVLTMVLRFLFKFNQWLGIGIEPRISEWLSFVLVLPLGFGIAFQLPLVMLFLERIGIFDVAAYLSKWRIAILVIFVLSMLLTPADPGSMMLMALPLTGLYFGGILLCRYMPRSRSPYDEPED